MGVELVPFPIREGMILIQYGYRDYMVGKVAHQMQDFQLDKHQKTFGGVSLQWFDTVCWVTERSSGL